MGKKIRNVRLSPSKQESLRFDTYSPFDFVQGDDNFF
jgi:hypothetical protein